MQQKVLQAGKKEVPTEIYTRVVGYYRPVAQFNKSKQAEFENRKEYDVNKKFVAGARHACDNRV